MGLSNKVVSSIETAAIEAKKCELILEYAAHRRQPPKL